MKATSRPRHRQPLHRIEAGGIFGARASAGTCAAPAPCRTGPRPGPACPAAARPAPRPPARHGRSSIRQPSAPAHPALERQPRDAGDRRQRLAAKAEAGHVLDRDRRAAWRSRAARAPGAFRPGSCRSRRRSLRSGRARPPTAAPRRCAAPASSAFSTSSLSALAGRSTTSPAAMRLMSSDGSLLIDMLTLLAQSEATGEALNFARNSSSFHKGLDKES